MKTAATWMTLALLPCAVLAGEAAHWTYSGAQGPDHWGTLAPEFSLCALGMNQSPIDLAHFIESDLSPLQIHYRADGHDLLNDGHTVQVNFTAGSHLDVDGRRFELQQVHFHAPSENLINGRSFPLEAHLVHADRDGHLAVIGVMFEQGAANATLAQAWAHLPQHAGERHALTPALSAAGWLPEQRTYYRYNGSLTTPPCNEGVLWLVMKQPLSASKQQIEQFAQLMQHPNNRPVQPVNARPVLQ